MHAANRRQLPDATTVDAPQLRGRAGLGDDPAHGTTDSLDEKNFAPDNETLVGEETNLLPQSLGGEAGGTKVLGGGYHAQHTARAGGGWSGGVGGAFPVRGRTRPGSAPSAR